MKTSFLPRPSRLIRPAPEPAREFTVSAPDSNRFTPIWNTEPDNEQYAAFPQAPEANAGLAEDLEQFWRTK